MRLGDLGVTGVIGDTGGRAGEPGGEVQDGSLSSFPAVAVPLSAFALPLCLCRGNGGIVMAFIMATCVSNAVN